MEAFASIQSSAASIATQQSYVEDNDNPLHNGSCCSKFTAFCKKAINAHNNAPFLWGGGLDNAAFKNQNILIARVFITVLAATILIIGVFTPLSPVIVPICISLIAVNTLSFAVKVISEKFFAKALAS